MLTGEQVVLRALARDEVATLQRRLADDLDTWQAAHSEPWRPQSAEALLAAYDAELVAADPSTDRLAVTRRDGTGPALGQAVLHRIDAAQGSAEVGVTLLRDARGRGVGSDALRVLCDLAFRVRGLRRLQLETLAVNAAMLATAAGCGFVEEGRLREAEWYDGGFADVVVHGLLAPEWAGSAACERQEAARADAGA